MHLQPWKHRWSRVTIISISLAVLAHVTILVIVAKRRAAAGTARPPSAQGNYANDPGTQATAGLPVTKRRNLHTFRVIAESDGTPIDSARVTDLLGPLRVVTDSAGVAVLSVIPVSKLIVRFEKPGFKPHTAQFPNTEREGSYTVILEREPVNAKAAAVPRRP